MIQSEIRHPFSSLNLLLFLLASLSLKWLAFIIFNQKDEELTTIILILVYLFYQSLLNTLPSQMFNSFIQKYHYQLFKSLIPSLHFILFYQFIISFIHRILDRLFQQSILEFIFHFLIRLFVSIPSLYILPPFYDILTLKNTNFFLLLKK